MTPRPRLVILDFDGTLADSFPWFCEVYDSVAERFRFARLGPDELQALRSCGPREVMERLGVSPHKVPAIVRHTRALKARDLHRVGLFPGIAEALRALSRAGVRLAIVSSDVERSIRQVLGPELAGLIDHYDCGASLFGKPAKMRAVLRRSGVAAAEALAIGDEVRDAEAARSVGMPFGAVAWGYALPEALAALGPAMMFRTPAAIAALAEAG